MFRNILFVFFVAIIVVMTAQFLFGRDAGVATNVRPVDSSPTNEQKPVNTVVMSEETESEPNENKPLVRTTEATESSSVSSVADTTSSRQQFVADEVRLPLSGSAPTANVKYSIPIEEIRQGCFRQDCIPSVDNPTFISPDEAAPILNEAPNDIGIALSYKGENRFYPFAMLVTREIVNDTIAEDPVLVTYCPLCGTGIVFDRKVNGEVQEFGVSGMLWQSNLLMYNRADSVENRNLWSQVLGEAVVGNNTGDKLAILPSNITRFSDWKAANPSGLVLNTGKVSDPYDGDYFRVAQQFGPNFDVSSSPLNPSAYVYGIEHNGQFKAYPSDNLPLGETSDVFAGVTLTITKSPAGLVTITDSRGVQIPRVEGFWFSWVAAHPDTKLWTMSN